MCKVRDTVKANKILMLYARRETRTNTRVADHKNKYTRTIVCAVHRFTIMYYYYLDGFHRFSLLFNALSECISHLCVLAF